MTELKIDSDGKIIEASAMLKGETSPIKVRLTYELSTTPDGPVTIRDISVSREWMNLLATEFLQNKEVPLPPKTAKFLRMVL